MSNFVTRLVQRGAGIPQPVSFRPAAGPADFPIAVPASSDLGLSPAAAPVTRFEPPHAEPAGRRESPSRVTPLPELRIASAGPTPPVQPPLDRNPVRPPIEPTPVVPGAPPTAKTSARVIIEPQRRIDPPVPPPARPGESPSERAANPAHPSTVRTFAASAAPPATVDSSRNIHVKIGKVEIRSSPPPQKPVKHARPRTSGFDDLRLSRSYLGRGR